MNYGEFFWDVFMWTQQVNQMVTQQAHKGGMKSPEFWSWVADSTSEISRKYQDHRLAIMQMMMLVEWLEEVYENQKGGARNDG